MVGNIEKQEFAKLFLRLGLALAFGYAGLGSLLQPDTWLGYLPVIISQLPIAKTILAIFSVGEIILVGWLLSGFKTKYAAIISAMLLIGIVGSNLSDLSILFRDLALIFSAIALALLT